MPSVPGSETLITLADWQAAYAAGATPGELIPALCERLLADSPSVAWIHRASTSEIQAQVDALRARSAAHADRASLLRSLPFFGVPFAVKDNIDVAGMPTTAACPAFAYRPATHATAVARLIEAGAVCVGKTNLDQFATGLVGARSPYGRPSSVFAPNRVSGGSSSGSAVVVARGDVPFALGTDTAGSGRVPAGFNNIVGLKPTPGRVGTRGVVPACRSLDCVSVFALTVGDAEQVLALIEGADSGDAYSDFQPGLARFPARLRVGVPAVPDFSGDAYYAAAYEQAMARARALGHTLVPIDFAPLHAVADLLYSGPWVAERHAAVQALLESQPDAFDPVVRRVVEGALGISATDAFRGQYRLRAAQRDMAATWQQADVLMVPSAPTHPTHADIDAEPIGANAQLGRYTNFVNLLGWSALALPASFTAARLPFGVTFIGPAGADAALVHFGKGWQAGSELPLGATRRSLSHRENGPGLAATQATLPIVVVGAHMSGLPLNTQMTERGAYLRESTETAPRYRLFALPNAVPPKPGLVRAVTGGSRVAVEVWEMPIGAVGSFLALIPPPLGLGNIELADGRWVHGFLCEAHALEGARNISSFGGWRAYLKSLKKS